MSFLVIGLGGGAISMSLSRGCPDGTLVDSVELDPAMVQLATKVFGFQPSQNNTVEVGDGLAALQKRVGAGQLYDAVLVDCFDGDRVPLACRSSVFLHAIKQSLREEGLLAQNVWARSAADLGIADDYAALQSTYAASFGRPLSEVVTDLPESREEILYAVKGSKWRNLLASLQ
mmetsp:Transcript_72658/g.193825  ORF Transcript_72658/g.193825 Transcript_72658/m.193825 type:complete len:174 (+) Transcript_72658:90-611(+)